jgi:hypothetical protein
LLRILNDVYFPIVLPRITKIRISAPLFSRRSSALNRTRRLFGEVTVFFLYGQPLPRPPLHRAVTFDPRGEVTTSVLMRAPERENEPARRTIGVGVRYEGASGGVGVGSGTWYCGV